MPNTSRTLGGRPKKKKNQATVLQGRNCFFPWILGALWKVADTWIMVSVQFSRSVVSDSLQPHGPQHARPPCPSPTPGVYPNSSPLSRLCHPTISSSFVPFSSCLQSFPASGFFQMSQLIASGGQSIGVSGTISVLPMNTQGWSPLGWIGWISCSPRDSQESSPALQFKSINSSALSFFYSPTFASWFQLFLNAALWNKIMGRNWFIVWEIFEFTKWLFTWRPLNVSREYCLKFELMSHIS